MKLETYTGSSNWGNLRILWAQIDSIDSDNDTANITILDEDKNKTDETFENIIFYYNCQDDMTKRSNGALEGSSMAFEKNDQVYVSYDLSDEDKTNLKIIGRLDGLKSCGESVILLIIDDSTQYQEGSSVFYVVKQYTIRSDFTLLELEAPGAKVSKYHNGTALVIQGSEDKNNSIATVADKFGFSERWDDIDGMEKGWGGTYSSGEGQTYIIGANNAWNPDEGMSSTRKARRNYIVNDDNEITSCYYAIKTDVLGTCMCYIGAYPTNRSFQTQWIKYRESVTGADIISSTYWTDYETGNPEQDGYTWKYHRVIAVVSPTNALLLTKRKVQTKSGFISRLVTLTVASSENLSIYGPCYAIGQCFVGGQFWYGIHTTHTIDRYSSQQIGVRVENTTYYETLEIGDITIENLSYNIKVEESFDDLSIYPFNTPIVSDTETDLCHGSCTGWDGQCTDSFSGGVKCEDFGKWNADFTVRKGNYCSGGRPGVQVDVLTIPAGATRTESGSNELHILGFDNYQGSKYIVLFYELTEVTLSEEVNEVGYDTAYSKVSSTKYYLYIKSDNSETKTLLATKTATITLTSTNPAVFTTTNTGNNISKVSCQINRGIAVYTYCVVNVESGAQEKRVVGYKNLTNSKYGTNQSKEYESSSDLNVSGTYWQSKIAVGITKG
ncbi:MAG: hypothetical protein HQK88_05945 [Nitrospirae bacterium]|nr:hypothetical protein [Nitrospirota bacterium]MBF0534612.1 hypothetical protein [Nitrospirota bacterium]MBF0616344.1 hypothetical protein [Nitrospirota bacterium]